MAVPVERSVGPQLRLGIDERGPIAFEQLGRRQSSVELRQLRLEIEQFQVAGRARHEQINDSLRFGGVMRQPGRQGVFNRAGPSGIRSTQQLRQRQCAQSNGAVAKEPSARYADRIRTKMCTCLTIHETLRLHSFVMVSSRFSSTRATTVHAACLGSGTELGAASSFRSAFTRSPGFAVGWAK